MSESRVALLRRAAESNSKLSLGEIEVDGETAKSLVALYDSLEGSDQEAMADDLYKNPQRAIRIAQAKSGGCTCPGCGGKHGLPPIVAEMLGALFGGSLRPQKTEEIAPGFTLTVLAIRPPEEGQKGADEDKP